MALDLQILPIMAVLATLVDFIHALLIFIWVVGLPLLIWHRFRRLSRAYAVYAVAFVVVNVTSSWLIGECPLTLLARVLWTAAPSRPPHTNEWFTVRFAEVIFNLAPSHHSIKLVAKGLILASSLGLLFWSRNATPKRARDGCASEA